MSAYVPSFTIGDPPPGCTCGPWWSVLPPPPCPHHSPQYRWIQDLPESFGNTHWSITVEDDAPEEGWLCPKCKRIWAPHVEECRRCNDE